MKRYKKIAFCMTASVIMQCGVLCYLDKGLLKESNEFQIQAVESPVKGFNTDIEIPDEAENIQVSYNGKYITYQAGGKLILVNTTTAEVKEILGDRDILNIKWVSNNNTIFVVANESGKVKIKTFNASNEVEQDVCELCSYEDDMKIDSFISTTAQYVSVYDENKTKVFRVNIEKEVTNIDKKIRKIESASVFKNKDEFIYQDSKSNKVYRYTKGKSSELHISNPGKVVVLGTSDEMIFLGEYSEGKKISKIIYGQDIEKASNWKTQTLDKETDIDDIYINIEGKIFINDSSKKTITNISDGKNITYKGNFVLVNDRVLCTLEDNKISLQSVKDNM